MIANDAANIANVREIRLWVYDECLASAVSGPLDVFATANAAWRHQHRGRAQPLLRVSIESPHGKPVRTSSGMMLPVDGSIHGRSSPDAIFLPGLWCGEGFESFSAHLKAHQALYPLLRRAHAAGSLLAANCSAAFLLAEAGLLDGRAATTTWWLASAFRARYPQVRLDARGLLTEDSRLVCSGATTAYLELALRVVALLSGPALAATCARLLLIDANRASQAAYMTTTLQEQAAHADPLVLRAQALIEHRPERPLALRQLARKLATSERTLLRRFAAALGVSPVTYAQRVRVETAKGLLETSSLGLQQICERVGYTDVGTFRRLFKRELGMLPSEYRRRYARPSGRARLTRVANSRRKALAL